MDNILTPGLDEEFEEVPEQKEEYLKIGNYLSEYENSKAIIQENLNVYSRDNTYNKDEVDSAIAEETSVRINKILALEDPYKIMPLVRTLIKGFVKKDGTVPFSVPQTGIDPTSPEHLATRRYVDNLLFKHMTDEDAHDTAKRILPILENYASYNDIYPKNLIYTKKEVDTLLKGVLRSNGSTPFTKPQVGFDPQVDNHLATKRYVDKMFLKHLVDIDPHDNLKALNSLLISFAKRRDVYSKDLVYTKDQVNDLINEALLSVEIPEPVIEEDPIKAVKLDGSVSIFAPLSGVRAKEPQHLVILKLVNELIDEAVSPVYNNLEKLVWNTNGPIQCDVGLLKKGTVLAPTLTLQEICDAIFYGNNMLIEFPDYVMIGENASITIYVHGSTGLLESVEIFQDNDVVSILEPELFKENGSVTIEMKQILSDLNVSIKANYTNNETLIKSKTIKMIYPVFVGALPKWKFPNLLTYKYLKKLLKLDTNSSENLFVKYTPDMDSVSFIYTFSDTSITKRLFIVVPEIYGDIHSMIKSNEKITDIEVDSINLEIEGNSIPYKVFIYKEPLLEVNQEIIYNFK